MTHKLKVLGLALCAVFAFSAVAAQGAWAVDTFTVEGGGSETVTGQNNNNVFKLTSSGVNFQCERSHFSGTITNGSSSATITPKYEGNKENPSGVPCDSSVGNVTIDMNGCDYDLTGSTTGADPTAGTDATVSITCPTGKEIEITNSLCNVFVHAQTPTSGGVSYANTPAGKVTVTATATGVTYRSSGSFCAFGGIPSEANDADYTGTVVVAGTNGKNISFSQS